jgi:DNA-binding winged helix-turn-helix (wHTH) protein
MNTRFGDFRLDSDSRQLFRGHVEVHLSPKAFELLRMLVEARPKAVSKADLTERLWPATFVSEANLPVVIAEIRGVLGDTPRNSRFVRTVHRFGYAFGGSAIDVPSSQPHSVPAGGRVYWLMSSTRRILLTQGESVLGRDPHVAIWLDAPGISRRHARILIANENATLEDLGSKNGTFIRDQRVTSPMALHDGDEIRLGSVFLTVRVWSPTSMTESEPTSVNHGPGPSRADA